MPRHSARAALPEAGMAALKEYREKFVALRGFGRRYIADLQEDWEQHGMAALKEYREKFVRSRNTARSSSIGMWKITPCWRG